MTSADVGTGGMVALRPTAWRGPGSRVPIQPKASVNGRERQGAHEADMVDGCQPARPVRPKTANGRGRRRGALAGLTAARVGEAVIVLRRRECRRCRTAALCGARQKDRGQRGRVPPRATAKGQQLRSLRLSTEVPPFPLCVRGDGARSES